MLGVLIRAALIVLAGTTAGLGYNALRSPAFDWRHPSATGQCAAPSQAPVVVQPAEIAHLCGTAGVIVADTRPADAYARGHIAGAVHLPCSAAGTVADEALGRLQAAATVLVYGEDTEEALPVAQSLQGRNLPDVRVIAGGFPAWSGAGLACASGPCGGCKEAGALQSHEHPESGH